MTRNLVSLENIFGSRKLCESHWRDCSTTFNFQSYEEDIDEEEKANVGIFNYFPIRERRKKCVLSTYFLNIFYNNKGIDYGPYLLVSNCQLASGEINLLTDEKPAVTVAVGPKQHFLFICDLFLVWNKK